jgi:predicted metal-binding membrane protein
MASSIEPHSASENQTAISSPALVTILALSGLILAGWGALMIALPAGIPSAAALWATLCSPLSQSPDFWTGYQASLAVWLPMVPAMMLPSAIPMALAFAARIERNGGALQPILLILAYIGVWLVAASLFAALQTLGGLALASLQLPEKAIAILGGFGLGLAGLWQFAPLKRLSLATCRHDFREAPTNPTPLETLRLGAEQGVACIGCCWVLMLAAAAAGAMSLIWMAVLAAVMTAEKMIGPRATAPLGLVLIGLGSMIAINAVGAGALWAYWRG